MYCSMYNFGYILFLNVVGLKLRDEIKLNIILVLDDEGWNRIVNG